MERKMLNLGRAKKKLRYFQEETNPESLPVIKDIFSLKDIDDMFDDLDPASDTGLPLLSPLPKSNAVLQCERDRSPSPSPKSPSPERHDKGTQKGSGDVVVQADGTGDSPLNCKESPFFGPAPIKTSSPIGLLTNDDRDGGGDNKIAEITPLLFGEEDEEPIRGDISQSQSNQKAEVEQESQPSGMEDLLTSPPKRLEFAKGTQHVVNMPENIPDTNTHARPEESTEERLSAALENGETSHMEVENEKVGKGDLVLRKGQETREVMTQEVKGSSFQQKLRESFHPKATVAKKHAALVRAPSPLELDDDFMILEDDGPLVFSIPRRKDPSRNGAPQRKEKTAVPDATTDADAGKPDSADKPTRSGAANQNQREDTEMEEDVHLSGKHKSQKHETGRRVNQEDNGGRSNGVSALKPSSKPAKKSSKPTAEAPSAPETLQPNAKKKTGKAKIGRGEETDATKPAKSKERSKKPGNDRAGLRKEMKEKSKQSASSPAERTETEKERSACPEPLSDIVEQNTDKDVSVAAEKTSTTRPPSAASPSKRAVRNNKARKMKETQTKTGEAVGDGEEPDTSADAPATGKRKRNKPGAWWLTNQDPSSTEEQEAEAFGRRAGKKRKGREPAASAAGSEGRPAEEPEKRRTDKPKTRREKEKTGKPKGGRVRRFTDSASQGNGRKAKAAPVVEPESSAPSQAEEDEGRASGEEDPSPVLCSPPARDCLNPGEKSERVFDKGYSQNSSSGSARKRPPSPSPVLGKRQRRVPGHWWAVTESQESDENTLSQPDGPPAHPQNHPKDTWSKSRTAPPVGTSVKRPDSQSVHTSRGRPGKRQRKDYVNTPKTLKGSLSTTGPVFPSGRQQVGLAMRKQGRKNLLHSLEDASEHSRENTSVHNDGPEGRSDDAAFDGYADCDRLDPFGVGVKRSGRLSSGSGREPPSEAENGVGFRSGPASMIELDQYEEEDADLPTSRVSSCVPRVLSEQDLCGPPLKPVVLQPEDWDNLMQWFTHLWPANAKEAGEVISPDHFRWFSHAGRAMGHKVNVQCTSFSNGKILLGSYMKKPLQVDHSAVCVFNLMTSCVRVEKNGLKSVYNPGQTFMIPSGHAYSIQNLSQEPAVLWYNRMLVDEERM